MALRSEPGMSRLNVTGSTIEKAGTRDCCWLDGTKPWLRPRSISCPVIVEVGFAGISQSSE